jgi:hypothetical protein
MAVVLRQGGVIGAGVVLSVRTALRPRPGVDLMAIMSLVSDGVMPNPSAGRAG